MKIKIAAMASILALVAMRASVQATDAPEYVSPSRSVNPCLIGHGSTVGHLHYLRISSIGTTRNDSLWRANTRVPVVTDTAAIVVVSDSLLCRGALNAYNAIVNTDSAATEIELLRADTVYVASHPAIASGEWIGRYVLDRSFNYLGSYFK
ncbi:MAG TPA: hypothetical protein VM033_05195 [Gemmatimonadaceae bacterium]|nr:hypothetical protein [Gemmatimonadaceae bacterium]